MAKPKVHLSSPIGICQQQGDSSNRGPGMSLKVRQQALMMSSLGSEVLPGNGVFLSSHLCGFGHDPPCRELRTTFAMT